MPILGLPESLYPTHPGHFDIEKVIRPNILALHPYRCARDDYDQGILLDANENALGHSITLPNGTEDAAIASTGDLHRYPSPSHPTIKARIAQLRDLPGPAHVFLGVGSDEVIDLLIRVCVVPGGREAILITPPTYGMYAVCAQVNDVRVVKVPLELEGSQGEGGLYGRFSARLEAIKEAVDAAAAASAPIKLIFLTSPGNPTGTLVPVAAVRALAEHPGFGGIIVVDEAYIDFAEQEQEQVADDVSAVGLVKEYANVCVMQTLSKSFGLAAIRLGIAIAHPALIQIMTNTKAPYNISTPTAHLALSALSPESVEGMRAKVKMLNANRQAMVTLLSKAQTGEDEEGKELRALGIGRIIGSNDANFIVVQILEKVASGGERKPDSVRALKLYKQLAEAHGVVVRFRGAEMGCEGCLRITVGSKGENEIVIAKFKELLKVI